MEQEWKEAVVRKPQKYKETQREDKIRNSAAKTFLVAFPNRLCSSTLTFDYT